MNNDLRDQAIGKPPFYHMHDGKPCYLDGAGIRREVPPELITLIRTATLEEVRPEVERLLTNEIVIANCINLETLNKAIDNLRGRDATHNN